jgi:hypothetical protein
MSADTATATTTATTAASHRRAALIAGIFYPLTFVSTRPWRSIAQSRMRTTCSAPGQAPPRSLAAYWRSSWPSRASARQSCCPDTQEAERVSCVRSRGGPNRGVCQHRRRRGISVVGRDRTEVRGRLRCVCPPALGSSQCMTGYSSSGRVSSRRSVRSAGGGAGRSCLCSRRQTHAASTERAAGNAATRRIRLARRGASPPSAWPRPGSTLRSWCRCSGRGARRSAAR